MLMGPLSNFLMNAIAQLFDLVVSCQYFLHLTIEHINYRLAMLHHAEYPRKYRE